MFLNTKNIRVFAVYTLIAFLFVLGVTIGNQAIQVVSEHIPIERSHCFIIDAGHGGEDGGAISCSGIKESIFNLQIALRLKDILEIMGYQTSMIRSTDTAVYTEGESIAQKKISDLKHRVRIANHTPSGILISIHQNTFPESQYAGAQVFYGKASGSRELAEKLQAELIQNINRGSNRKEKRGKDIYLLEKTTIPAVLIECGFLSNLKEETLLQMPEYQKKLCCIIAATLSNSVYAS